jgi:hypothetical protein
MAANAAAVPPPPPELAAAAAMPPQAAPQTDLQVDAFLLSALANPRDRLAILKLDFDLEKFVRDVKYCLATLAP